MKKILIYLIKDNKKYAVLFNNDIALLKLEDLFDITKEQIIDNGSIPLALDILEKWEIKSAKIKSKTKNRNTLKLNVDLECKLLIRKTSTAEN